MSNGVLVVDDDAQIGRCLRRTLRGCEVHHAATGSQALAILSAGARYDVIFVDVALDDMSGVQFVESVYRLAADQASRIVFVTGGDTDALRRQFPAHCVITKPFAVSQVRGVVDAEAKRASEPTT